MLRLDQFWARLFPWHYRLKWYSIRTREMFINLQDSLIEKAATKEQLAKLQEQVDRLEEKAKIIR